ncbi:MAG: ribose 5-phosphate isomerase B [Phycisphaeraceae bacterium]|nr:ribose 5-phosphate isomerase B [Phycisphaeraceae bacterium]MCW5761827.1 ribose 5-phosphate isomerase B [Phycisphaeraceae bacterium]
MKIVIGSDHRGHSTTTHLATMLETRGLEVEVLGSCGDQPCDYPEGAWNVGQAIRSGRADLGILICGTGIGMGIAANKIPGVRAAVVHDELTAQLSRSHNNANVLCLSADLLGERLIEKIVDVWLKTEFEGGRHARRVGKIAMIEEGKDPASVT